MKLTIDTWQRATLVTVVGRLQGPVAMIRNAGKLLDILEFSEEEQVEVGMIQTPVGLQWSNRTRKWDIEIPDGNQAELLKRAAQQFDGWPAGNREQVFDLIDQLDIAEEGTE